MTNLCDTCIRRRSTNSQSLDKLGYSKCTLRVKDLLYIHLSKAKTLMYSDFEADSVSTNHTLFQDALKNTKLFVKQVEKCSGHIRRKQ